MLTRVRRRLLTAATTVFVTALVAAGLWLQAPQLRPGKEPDPDRVLLKLYVQRLPNSKMLTIRTSVNTVPQPDLSSVPYGAPYNWERKKVVLETDRVLLSVTQEGEGLVTCSLVKKNLRTGKVEVVDDSQRTDAGSVRCYMNR